MRIDAPLFPSDIEAINTFARRYSPALRERERLAQIAGVSVRTVERWFTNAGQQIGLLPATLAGASLWDIQESGDFSMFIRASIGLLLTSDIEKDGYFSGAQKEFEAEVSTVTSAAVYVWDLLNGQKGTILKYGSHTLIFYAYISEPYLSILYTNPEKGEVSEVLRYEESVKDFPFRAFFMAVPISELENFNGS